MGNAESNIDDDPLEQFTSEEEKGTSGDSSITDYSVLLDEETLKKALSKYPDVDLPPIARHSDKIRKWLNSVNQHGMDVMVTLDEFVDTVKEFGVSQEECKLFFHHLDRYGENSIAAVTLLSELTGLSSKLSNILTGLIPCRLEPNICDVFVDDKSSCSDFGPQLMQFLQRNRASSDQLVSTSLEVHHSTMKLRDMYVKACFSADISHGTETAEDSPEGQRVTISRCYSNIAVSTNQGSMNNLLDSNPQTYWQSNGSPRTHWIRFTILSGIVISELAISVDTGDESYMPHHVSISVGNVPTSLKELKTVFIPKETTGKFVLIRGLSNPYKFVQVNVRRCHRDGCDTRVRGIHVRGCRFVAAAQPSVFDSVAIWYLSMMSTTAQAAMPLAPTLKPLLLQQTKGTLCSLKPLALSPSSKDKPEMLDIFVVAELTKFVKSLCQKGDTTEMDVVDPEQLSILLKYMLIIGDVSGILNTLQCVLENMHLSLPCQPLLKDLASMTTEKRNRRSISIRLKIESCDGGQKDDEYKIDNCINKTAKPSEPSSSARPYVTEEGKKVVNIIVGHHSGSKLDVQKVTLLGQKGGQSPKLAVLFLLKDLPKSGNLLEHFTKYDTLGKAELEQLVDNGNLEQDPTQAKPVAVVSMGVEEEVAVTFEKCTPCSYVYVKFVGTKEENAERMGIQKLAVHGQTLHDCDALLEYHSILATVVPIPEETDVPSSTLVGRVIGFLIHMLLDLKVIKDRLSSVEQDLSSIAEGHLAVQSLTLEKIWSLYFPFAMESKPTSKKLACLCLLMLYSALPFISQASEKSDSGSSDMCKTILTHLCSLIDSESEDQAIKDIAKECITSGIPVFYPLPSTRQDHLMEMLSGVSSQQSRSWMLTFKGLCQYFVLKDSFKLLQLPVQPKSASEVKVDRVMSVLTKILDVTCQRVDLNTEETGSEERDILVHLLQAIQQNLFHWCSKVAREKKRELRELASSLVLRYSILFLENMEDLLSRCVYIHSSLTPAQHIPKTVATSVLPQFLYFLNTATLSNSFYCLKLLQPLIVLLNSLISIQKKCPELFPTPISKLDTPELESESKPDEDKKEPHLLNVWVRESSSTSEQEVSKDEKFFCPLATKMVVEFDSSSSTSSRFDKLEFMSGSTSSIESVHGSAGSSDWPKSLDFATSELSFRFNTISSNSSWVYKFVVKAYGPKPTSLTYFSDLQFTVAHLIGNLCSRVIGSQHMEEDDKDIAEEDEESSDKRRLEMSRKAEKWLISSDVWKKMFRGGVTDRFSRSLSTMHSSIPAGSELNKLLTDLAHGTGSMDIIEQCRAAHSGPQMHYGGPQVDKAINAVFAALIWHSQEVRDELSKSGDKPLIATQGVRDAYAMAQYLRRELVEARQKVITARDTDETSSNHSAMDEDKPVNDCLQKALFLLKFAGLMKAEKPRLAVEAATPSRSAFIQKYRQWQKGRSVSSSKKMSESQITSVVETEKSLAQKYPSFRIMMEFLRKTSVTKEMVERFLEHRQKAAKNLSAVLCTIFDLLQSMDIFSDVGLTFLCQLLSCQYSFAGHYIRDLEGCGLEVENEARIAYSRITNHLLEKLKPYTQLKAPVKPLTMEVLLTKAYLLHLLDVQWQNYDMLFISESHLPEFLLSTAIQVGFEHTESSLPKQENEDEMLERHKLFLRHLSVVKSSTSLSDLMASMELGSLDKEAHLFIVSAVWHTEKLSIHVQCDGCTTNITSSWYRDMEAMDLDLCKRCFFERPDKRPVAHHISHKFLELRYLCDCCRIMITSHRLHCETKTDFDLCLGCFRQKEQEGTLDPKDRWTLYPLTLHNPEKDKVNTYYTTSQEHVTAVPLASAEKPKEKRLELLKAYVSQHGFLQFTQICLSMAQVLNMSESEVEESYLNSVAVIYFDCLKLLTFCLRCAIAKSQATPKEDTDSVVISQETQSSRPRLLRVTSVTDHPEAFSEMGEMEKVFCYNKLDKLMGLLALMLPIDMQLPRWVTENPNVSQLLSERLLPALIDISRGENPEHSVQSLCLLAQFLVRISPMTADRACQVTQSEGAVEQASSGLRTIEYLCSTGALHLEKSDFASASTVSRILIRLGGCDSWKEAVAAQLKSCLEKKPQEMIMSDIFKLYTLAGFPGLPCIGTVMEFGEGSETRRAVITSVPSNQVSLITLDKRETMLSSLADLRMEKPPVGCVDESHIKGLVNVLSQLHRLSGGAFTTETFFVLSLTLKALRTALTTVDPGNLEPVLSDPKMMSWIGLVARKPTEMDKKWLLHHLEAYLVNSYQQKTAKVSPGSSDGAQKEQEEKKEPVKKDPKEGLSETANEMFDTMMEAFNCTAAVLRGAYDISGGDIERWLVLLQECFEDSMFKPSDRILDKAKEWEPQPVQVIAEKIQESGDDSGLVNFSPRKIDIENVTAVAEIGALKPKVSLDTKDSKDEKGKDEKMEQESLEMLLRELKKLQDSPADSNHLLKTANAVAILQAREFIVSILTHWPWKHERVLSPKVLLGETDTMKNFGMVDLICSTETDQGAKMVVRNIMEYGDPREVQELVVVAAECMGELTVGTESVEGTLKEDKKVTGTIVIPNASSLTVTFDEKSSFEGSIALTSSVSGTGDGSFEGNKLAGKMHILPGDTVNYTVTYTGEDRKSSWKMEIVGSQTGRFDTGCMILKMWLSQAGTKKWNLPLADLWPHLVLVACQNPGQKRLQVIGLLLEILSLYREMKTSGTDLAVKELDLSLLKPLWKLYYSILGEVESNEKVQLVPDIVKALTELFMVMESFGKDLGVDQPLLNDLWLNEKIMSLFNQGVCNVAFLSLGAGLNNKLSTVFVESKHKQDLGAIASLTFQAVDNGEDKGDTSDSDGGTSDDSDDYTTTEDDDDDDDNYGSFDSD